MISGKIKHIFFDLDHTLWDFDKNSALTFEAIFRGENLVIDLPHFLKTYIPINNDYWKLYRENKITQEALRTGRLRDCFNCMEVEISQEVIENLATNYIKLLPNYNNLLEDAVDVLEYLKNKYALHVITNGFEEVQHLKLLNSEISAFFNTVTTSEEAGVKKPDKKIFALALDKANGSPEESVMIGDNYEADILGAEGVGMQTIFFDYYRHNNAAEISGVQKLKDLKMYL